MTKKPNPSSNAGNLKRRKRHIKCTLKALEALIEGKSLQDVQSYGIETRRLEKLSIPDLLDWRRQYENELLAIERQLAGNTGTVRVVFE